MLKYISFYFILLVFASTGVFASDTVQVTRSFPQGEYLQVKRTDSTLSISFGGRTRSFKIKKGTGQDIRFDTSAVDSMFTAYIDSLRLGVRRDLLVATIGQQTSNAFTILITPAQIAPPVPKDYSAQLNIAIILLIILLLAVAFLIFNKIKPLPFFNKGLHSNGRYDVPEPLITAFNNSKNEREAQMIVSTIIEQYEKTPSQQNKKTAELESKFQQVQKIAEEKEKDAVTRQGEIERLNGEIKELKDKQKELSDEIKKRDDVAAQQKETARIILDKFLQPMLREMEANRSMPEEEAIKMLLPNMLAIGLHSASQYRMLTGIHKNTDVLNNDLLNGKPAPALDKINEHVQLSKVSPFVSTVMRLLRTHNLNGLEGVYVDGYKIEP